MGDAPALEGAMIHTDPVCGMQVEERQAGAKSTYRGQTFYFCMKACREAFERDPERYYNPGGMPPG